MFVSSGEEDYRMAGVPPSHMCVGSAKDHPLPLDWDLTKNGLNLEQRICLKDNHEKKVTKKG